MAVTNACYRWLASRLFATLVVSCTLCQTSDVFDGTVHTACGAMEGTSLSQAPGVWAFRGLRYASPPLGELRWKAPQPASCNPRSKILAHRNGQVCTQKNPILGYLDVGKPETVIRILSSVLLSTGFAIVLCYYIRYAVCRDRRKVSLQGGAGTDRLLGETLSQAPSNFGFFCHCCLCLCTFKCFAVGTFLLYFSFAHKDYLGRVIGGEDCLFLNIYAHENTLASPGASLPVVFFVHGGDLTAGSGTDSGPAAFYGGSWALAQEGRAVAVQTNYRLSALGFLYLEDQNSSSVLGNSANLGLLDQLAALEWVRDHIADFGGNPNMVTIYGQSSGGTSIAALLASPLATGLFHRAFTMSASPRIDATLKQAATAWRRYFLPAFPECVRKWKAEDLKRCLYSLSAQDIVDFMPGQYSDPSWMDTLPMSNSDDKPVILMVAADGHVVLGNVSSMYSQGDPRVPNVPTVFGSVREECDLDLKQIGSQSIFDNAAWPFSQQKAMQWGVQLTGDMDFGERVWRLYPTKSKPGVPVPKNPDDSSSPIRQRWSQLTSDMRSICGNIYNAEQLAKGQKAPVYTYLFTHRPQSPVVSHIQGWPKWIAQDSSQYAFHMWDVILLFNRTAGYLNADADLGYTFTALDFAVADRFREQFFQFAETGQIKAWTRVEPGKVSVCKLDSETTCDTLLKKEECALFEQYGVAYNNWIVN